MPDNERQRRRKVSVGLRMDEALIEQLRNAVGRIGGGMTAAGVMEEGTLKALAELEKDHSRGQPFPQRTEELAVGGARKRGEAPKAQVKMLLRPEDLERLRNAVAFFQAVSAVIEGATLKALEGLAKAQDKGEPYPPREGELPKSANRKKKD